jgi:hypothetical protein
VDGQRQSFLTTLYMRWLKTLYVSSIQSLWGTLPQGLETAAAQARLQELRQLMLDACAPAHEQLRHVELARRILHARSIAALWYLRADLMQALAGDVGEVSARRMLSEITQHFEGLIPEAGGKGNKSRGRASRTADRFHPTHPM